MKNKQKKNGISLIVLIITIIVMLILAAAIILSINNSGIVDKANEATRKSDMSNARNIVSLARAEWELDKELQEIPFKRYAEQKLESEKYDVGTTNAGSYHVTSRGEIYLYPVIPTGFVASIYDGEQSLEDGLVIYETTSLTGTSKDDAQITYNQYVWIPVANMSDFVTRDGYQNRQLQTFVSDKVVTEPFNKTTPNGITLSAENDLTKEFEEYGAMKKSVEKYGGFYIARYEAGSAQERTDTSNNTTTLVASMKNVEPYNYVGWGPSMTKTDGIVEYNSKKQGIGAVELSRSVYPKEENHDVVSTLVYGVQWDAAMYFMRDIQNPNVDGKLYIEDSTGMGKYRTNDFFATSSKTGVGLANSANMVKNIYDMAGNMFEWTMEGYSNTSREARGGCYYGYGYELPASARMEEQPTFAHDVVGFRIALYIK